MSEPHKFYDDQKFKDITIRPDTYADGLGVVLWYQDKLPMYCLSREDIIALAEVAKITEEDLRDV